MDQEFIKQLSQEVSVAPICAKADAMTEDECEAFQALIRDRLHNGQLSLILLALFGKNLTMVAASRAL